MWSRIGAGLEALGLLGGQTELMVKCQGKGIEMVEHMIWALQRRK